MDTRVSAPDGDTTITGRALPGSDERRPLIEGTGARSRRSPEADGRETRGRDEADVAIRDGRRTREPTRRFRQPEGDEEDDEAADTAEELRYGAHSMVKLIIPVTLCMAVVTASMLAITNFGSAQSGYLVYTPFHENGNESSGQKFGEAVINVIIILVVVVVMTILLVCLFKYRCYKAVTVWLIGASVLALGWFSIYYLQKVWQIYNVYMDWITAVIISWNFAVAGIFAIHWQGPLRVRQFCLVSTCVFIALIFIQFLPPWTGWVLLALIAVYDLVAVLTPCGPLRKLVELAQERDEPLLPSLVYSTTMMWTVGMADQGARSETGNRNISPRRSAERQPLVSEDSDVSDVEVLVEDSTREARQAVRALGTNRQVRDERQTSEGESGGQRQRQEDEEEEDKGVRLGLGDFIFYSILVGKAAVSSDGDWNVIMACFIAILIGLCLTTILLAILRKALPALPISIAFGLVFYFTTKEVITPFMDTLHEKQVFV